MRTRSKLGILTISAAAATLLAGLPGRADSLAAKGWNAPVLVSGSEAARETSLALSPTDARSMVVCDPSGVPDTSDGQSYFHRTTDGGRSWKPLKVETAVTDTRKYAFEGGDCDVAFDAGGTMYSADTWIGNLSVGHSTDGGATWDGTALAVSSPVVDRPWLAGGPKGTVYLSYQDVQCCTPSAIWFTKSTDYGKTFSPAVPVATAAAGGAFTWEGNFVVSPSGTDVYLVHSRRTTPGLTNVDDSGAEIITVTVSHDSGLTWTPHDITTLPARTASIYPSIGMDAAGYLHVAYSAPRDGGDTPVWYTISKDHALTWATPKPLKPRTSGYAPWVAGGKAGEAAIAWLGTPDVNPDSVSDTRWYFYTARVTGAGAKIVAGPTTTRPMHVGQQTTPEFEMVRLDRAGKMHLGMSVFRKSGSSVSWVVYYQREH